MNYFDLYSSYPDRTIAAAWDSQVKEADNTWLAGALTECGGELFGRFAACYAELRALPRSARRALQRRLARSSELGRDLAGILPPKWKTTTTQNGLVLGRCRFTTHAGTRSGDGGHHHGHHKRSKDHTRWTMFPRRGDRQRQQRCGDACRLRGGQWSGYDCPAGKRQRDALKSLRDTL